MKLVAKYLKPYIWLIVGVVILTVFRAITELLLPNYLEVLIRDGIDVGRTDVMWKYAGIMFVIIIAGVLGTIVSSFLEARISTNFGYDLRLAVYDKVSQFSIEELNSFTVSSLITRSTQDIQQLQGVTNMSIRMLIFQPILAVGGIIFAIKTHAPLSIIIAVGIVSLIVMLATIFMLSIPKFSIMQRLYDRINLVTRENLSGIRVIRAFDGEKHQEQKFDDVNKEVYKTGRYINILLSMAWPFMSVVMGLMGTFIIYFAARDFVNVDGFGYESLISLNIYASRVIMAFMMMSFLFVMIPRALVSARRINDVLDRQPSISDPENPHPLFYDDGNYYYFDENDEQIYIQGKVEFKDVCFRYPDAEASMLRNINFTVNPGETVAFIGSTGSGKSTLINLIPRLYDVTEGQILVDGMDIKSLTLKDLRSFLGYIPQQGFLFSGSIRENISYGKDISDEDIWNSLDIAQGNFVKDLDGGLDYQIAQGGTNVSGGQRQRLSIARAIANRPRIYIFDDSFSALDFKTDAELRKRISKVVGTKLIVAQRVSTVMNADRIIVLDRGDMVASGKHTELLKTCPIYYEIAQSQLTEEELANE